MTDEAAPVEVKEELHVKLESKKKTHGSEKKEKTTIKLKSVEKEKAEHEEGKKEKKHKEKKDKHEEGKDE